MSTLHYLAKHELLCSKEKGCEEGIKKGGVKGGTTPPITGLAKNPHIHIYVHRGWEDHALCVTSPYQCGASQWVGILFGRQSRTESILLGHMQPFIEVLHKARVTHSIIDDTMTCTCEA